MAWLKSHSGPTMRLPTQGWTALATVDVNSDGYTDLITGGLGNVGCWLKNPASQTFIWQADACGLIVDGDAWVSSIETLDVNDDGVGDIWLNLMSRRGNGWVGKPNALWLSSNARYVRGADFLKSSPPHTPRSPQVYSILTAMVCRDHCLKFRRPY